MQRSGLWPLAPDAERSVPLAAACALAALLLCYFAVLPFAALCWAGYVRRRKLAPIPRAPGALPLLGNLVGVGSHPLPWQLMLDWCYELNSNVVRWNLPFEDWVVVRGGECMRAVLQTNFKHFSKETAMSFKPFLCILGTGLVTSHGQLWQQQRKLMTPAFKGEALLSNVIGISVRAVARMAAKLEQARASVSSVEISEEFRLLTLQARCCCASVQLGPPWCLHAAAAASALTRAVPHPELPSQPIIFQLLPSHPWPRRFRSSPRPS